MSFTRSAFSSEQNFYNFVLTKLKFNLDLRVHNILPRCSAYLPPFHFIISVTYVNNYLKRTADEVLLFLDKTSVCTHPWHLNDLIVFTVSLNLTELKLCEMITNEMFYVNPAGG